MPDYFKGKGAQVNPTNRFDKYSLDETDHDGIDEKNQQVPPSVQIFMEHAKGIISQISSPDIPADYSINAYQGCEHGCTYCYARESHQYWGFSSGLDFESKIVVKKNAPELLRIAFKKKGYKPGVIMLSGNTDCYQPIEKKFELTRSVLQVMLEHRNPVTIVTKNSLVLRDRDILEELAKLNLVHVTFSINTLKEDLRRLLEPRTATVSKKLDALSRLQESGVPTGVLIAPVIPGLNHHEIPDILEKTSTSGAMYAGYQVVRLNGEIVEIFEDWLGKNFPERKEKVLNQIREMHNGKLQDRRFGIRMKGRGEHSKIIKQLFEVSRAKHFAGRKIPKLNTSIFRRSGTEELF